VSGLRYVVWELTLACDLACRHCGSRAGRARRDELTTAEALDLVAQIAALGAVEITLIGGEAYLRDDWTEIVRAIKRHGMEASMTTGGRGMTAERARAGADAGLDTVSVSLDGLEAAHDHQRGRGSFAAARVALANLRAAGVPVSVNTQLNRVSAPDLEALLEVLTDEHAHAWQVQLTVPMGRAADRPDWLLQPEDLLSIFPRLAAVAEEGRRRGILLWPGNNVGYFGPHEEIIRNRGGTGPLHWDGCVAGVSGMGVEADGTIKGCPSLPTAAYAAANIRDERLAGIWPRTRARTDGDLWGYCAGCYYADVCRGGCSWTAHVFFGKPGNNPYCHHRALEHRSRGVRERLVQVERAAGEPFDHGRFEIVVEPIEPIEPVEPVEPIEPAKLPKDRRHLPVV
jgi:radical SAM protein with 4Fe4S-binding SPASM domain